MTYKVGDIVLIRKPFSFLDNGLRYEIMSFEKDINNLVMIRNTISNHN